MQLVIETNTPAKKLLSPGLQMPHAEPNASDETNDEEDEEGDDEETVAAAPAAVVIDKGKSVVANHTGKDSLLTRTVNQLTTYANIPQISSQGCSRVFIIKSKFKILLPL